MFDTFLSTFQQKMGNKRNFTLLGGTATIVALSLTPFAGIVAIDVLIPTALAIAATSTFAYSIMKNLDQRDEIKNVSSKNRVLAEHVEAHIINKSTINDKSEVSIKQATSAASINGNINLAAIFFATASGILASAKALNNDDNEQAEMGLSYSAMATGVFAMLIYLPSSLYFARQLRVCSNQLEEEKEGFENKLKEYLDLQSLHANELISMLCKQKEIMNNIAGILDEHLEPSIEEQEFNGVSNSDNQTFQLLNALKKIYHPSDRRLTGSVNLEGANEMLETEIKQEKIEEADLRNGNITEEIGSFSP